jgi:hypothetical protein
MTDRARVQCPLRLSLAEVSKAKLLFSELIMHGDSEACPVHTPVVHPRNIEGF